MIPTYPAIDRLTIDGSNGWRDRGRRVVVAVCGLALAVDFTIHRSVDGRAGTLLSVAATVAMLFGARVRRPACVAIALLAPVFGVWLSLRESPWLLTLDLVAISGLLLLAAGFNGGSDPLNLSFVDAGRRALRGCGVVLHAPVHVIAALAAARSNSASGHGRDVGAAILRGLFLAAPIALAAGVLLASADGVFASLLHVPVGADSVFVHVGALAIGATAALVLIEHAYAPIPPSHDPRLPTVGTLELTMVLGVLVALYGMFAAAQAIALTRGAEYVRRTTGLTYSEYARRGYFQLLAVAALTVLVLLAIRPYVRVASTNGRRALVVLGETAIALTLVIIVAAIHRLNVYDDVFGLTMLRLSCIVFAWWLAAVFVLIALAYVRGGHRQWLAPAVVASALVTLFVWNAANPEAIVARHNITHATSTVRFDAAYLASLSDDAVPTVVANLSLLSAGDRAELTRALCENRERGHRGFWSANVSNSAAQRALQQLC